MEVTNWLGFKRSRFEPQIEKYLEPDQETATKIRRVIQTTLNKYRIRSSDDLIQHLRSARNFYCVKSANVDQDEFPNEIYLHIEISKQRLVALVPDLWMKVYLCWKPMCDNKMIKGSKLLLCKKHEDLEPKQEQFLFQTDSQEDWLPEPIKPDNTIAADKWKTYLDAGEGGISRFVKKQHEIELALSALTTHFSDNHMINLDLRNIPSAPYRNIVDTLKSAIHKHGHVALSYCPERKRILYMFDGSDDWSLVCDIQKHRCLNPCEDDELLCHAHIEKTDKKERVKKKIIELVQISDWNLIKPTDIKKLNRLCKLKGEIRVPDTDLWLTAKSEDDEALNVVKQIVHGRHLQFSLCKNFFDLGCRNLAVKNNKFCNDCDKATTDWKVYVLEVTRTDDTNWIYVGRLPVNSQKTDKEWFDIALAYYDSKGDPIVRYHKTTSEGINDAEDLRTACILYSLILGWTQNQTPVNILNSCTRINVGLWKHLNFLLNKSNIELVHATEAKVVPREQQLFNFDFKPPSRFSGIPTVYQIYHPEKPQCYIGALGVHKGTGRDVSRIVAECHEKSFDPTMARRIDKNGRLEKTLATVNCEPGYVKAVETLFMLAHTCANYYGWNDNILVNKLTSSYAFPPKTWFYEFQRIMLHEFNNNTVDLQS